MTRDKMKGVNYMKQRIVGRAWSFVMYPESMPENWESVFIELGIPAAISPLHDKDKDPTGEDKKPHYHVIVYYENPTTFNNVKTNICDRLNATIPIKLESIRGMYRYHIHIDNPDKYQYDDRDRKLFNGFDVELANKLTKNEVLKMLIQIYRYCDERNISEYSDLVKELMDNELIQLLDVISFNTLPVKTFLESKRYKKREHEKKVKELLSQ